MLQIAPEKCSITFFTPDKSRQSKIHPQVSIARSAIPLDKTPRILGVRLDTHYTFSSHAMDVVRFCKNKLRTLRALAGSGWGCQKEVLLRAYKTYVEPCINYAAPIWAPNVSASSISLIQRIQNRALRIATGCHMASSLSHIHQEAKFAFTSDHLSMLCSQFLASSLCPSHPSNAVVTAPPGPRPMKHTLKSKYFSSVEPLLVNGSVDTANHRATLSQIHTQAVNNTISKLEPNPLLGTTPPPISPSESRLPRNQRTTLA